MAERHAKRGREDDEEGEEVDNKVVEVVLEEEEDGMKKNKKAKLEENENENEDEENERDEEDENENENEEENEEDGDGDEYKVVPAERLRRTCWIPEVAGSSAEAEAIEAPEFKFDHRADLTCFGGVRPWLGHNEEWPRCKNGTCGGRSLQFFLQIDFRFAPDEAARKFAGADAGAANKLLQLFVCWECETTYDAFSKAVLVRIVPVPPVSPSSSGGTLVSLASHSLATTLDSLPGKDAVQRDLELTGLDSTVSASQALLADIAANEDTAAQLAKRPRDDDERAGNNCSFDVFPFKRLVRWTPREDWPGADERDEIAGGTCVIEGVDKEDDLDESHPNYHDCKLGGWAYWVQSVLYPECTECGGAMTNVVFNIGEDEALPYDWGDGGTGQILQCPTHLDVLAYSWAV